MKTGRLDEAFKAEVIRKTNTIFVDFDHTLFGCNSTELFIASCKPNIIIALIDFLLRVCIPWRLSGIQNWYRIRDYICVIAILILTPWNLPRWKRIAPTLFEQQKNSALAALLESVAPDRVVIVSFGMKFIIEALLRRSGFGGMHLLATPLASSLSHFRRGKLPYVQDHFDPAVIRSSAFVTDSRDDDDLLSAVEMPLLIEPHGALYRAEQQLYFPLRYTARVKYSFRYVIDQLVFVDLPIVVVAVSADLHGFLQALVTVPFLFLALMCVYELGYFENDMKAARSEPNPTLSGKESGFINYPIHVGGWIWAITLSAAGLLIALALGLLDQSLALKSFVGWIVALVLIRLTFSYYNSVSVQSRIYLYPALQILKYAAIFLVFAATTVGTFLVLAQVTTMWVIYLIYRLNGNKLEFQKENFRLFFFIFSIVIFAAQRNFDLESQLFGLVMALLWLVFRVVRAILVKIYKDRAAKSQTVHG